MGSDLISRSALLEEIKLQKWYAGEMQNQSYRTGFIASLSILEGKIEEIPAVDAEPVRHGRWMLNKHYGDNECSVCGEDNFRAWDFGGHTMNYCPNCGAKMDAEVKE